MPRNSDINGHQSKMTIHSIQQASAFSKSSSKTTLVKKPAKPKQFSLKDLAVFSAKIKVKDLIRKDMTSMFRGKYIKIEEEKLAKQKVEREEKERVARELEAKRMSLKPPEDHDFKQTPIFK